MHKSIKNTLIFLISLALFSIVWASNARVPLLFHEDISTEKEEILPEVAAPPDTLPKGEGAANQALPYPFEDNSWDPFYGSGSGGLYLRNPTNITSGFDYNPETGNYDYNQRIGDRNYRNPVYMSFDEYNRYNMENYNRNYWRERIDAESAFADESKPMIPKIHVGGETFDRIFGGNTVDIRPQGTAMLQFGVLSNFNDNPALPVRNRRVTTFDFDQQIQLGIVGQIGDKLRITANQNTMANFDFENTMKLEYTGYEDDIIKKIEAGNVNLPLSGSLITGSQSLFGIKTQLQFGKLMVTNVLSQQRGKRQEMEITGGSQTNRFEISADNYEANKHYLLAQYFRDNYDDALSTLPAINTTINITKIEVWLTNNNFSATTNTRNIIAFQDLGEIRNASYYEKKPDYISLSPGVNPARDSLPDKDVNTLYRNLQADSAIIRDFSRAPTYLEQKGFVYNEDFTRIEGARLLPSSEYSFNPQLGFISLNQTLNPNQVLAVAFQYTIGGSNKVYQVGEFSTDVTGTNPLIVKLLKSSNLNTQIPMWDLMMKNVYSLQAYNVNPEGFRLQVFYASVDQGLDVNYLSEGSEKVKGIPLLQVLDLDRLNTQGDHHPDGLFDFLDGKTINARNGRIYFPAIEPFGDHLRQEITGGNPELQVIANKYVFDPLYDTTKIAAQQRPDLNRFKIKGTYQSSSSSDISLNAFNIPPGSVTVSANGRVLTENTDYTVDYQLGRVKIINPGLLSSNSPIKVSLENQGLGFQQKSLFGTHLDYRISKDFNLGATMMNLNERPLTQKVNQGEEPMSNTVWGLDGNYHTESPLLTKIVDKIPFLDTKEMSTITATGEFAQLLPGNSRAIGKEGTSYIDDFEGSQSTIDIRSANAWSLASTPQGQSSLFPEGNLVNNLANGFNRARLAWYTIDPSVFFRENQNLMPDHLKGSAQLSNHYTREVLETEIFPQRDQQNGFQITNMPVLDLAFYPTERGQYNYDVAKTKYSAGLRADGLLENPSTRWGGIMRKLDLTDFQSTNVEYIQFWIMDPFHPDNGVSGQRNHSGGDLYFNLGNISEDVLRDNRKAFENGLPSTATIEDVDTTVWGRVPELPALVNAFDNDPASRVFQDVGLDGLPTSDELSFFDSAYIQKIVNEYGTGSAAYQQAVNDPSADNFHYFRGEDYDAQERTILQRYKDFNGMENNSQTPEQSNLPYPTAATTLPNAEDLNRDNTLEINESYYQYKVSLRPGDMQVGKNYIVNKVTGTGITKDGQSIDVDWYQFKIPVQNPQQVVGGLQDFTSINFMRMYLRGFTDSVICRFARLEFARSDWRKYQSDLQSPGEYITTDNGSTLFDVTAVNLEENGDKTPVNYVLPPDIERVVNPVGNAQLVRQNEQSMSLKVCGLDDGDARAAYKNMNLDIRSYKKLKMFVHAEAVNNQADLKDNDLKLFVRLGRDYEENYYEYEIPLKVTPWGKYNNDLAADRRIVWPEANNVEIEFEKLYELKMRRNDLMVEGRADMRTPFDTLIGEVRLTVRGNPSLNEVTTVMIGVKNPKKTGDEIPDDALPKCAEIWVNELRLTDFDKRSGYAATSRVTAKLADFGTVTLAGNLSTPGWGSIEKKVSELQRETRKQYDISTQAQLGKLLPEQSNISIPLFYNYSEGVNSPEFDPNNPDLRLKDVLKDKTPEERKEIKKVAEDYTRRKSINFTDVRKTKAPGATESHIYDIENVSVSYSFNDIFKRDVNTDTNTLRSYRANLSYNYGLSPKNVKPFGKSTTMAKSKYLKWLSDFNFYYLPNKLAFSGTVDRSFTHLKFRGLADDATVSANIPSNYTNNFLMTRSYQVGYDFSKSLKFNFNANNLSRFDESQGPDDLDSVIVAIKRGDENTNYNHAVDATYDIPVNKLPMLDWVSSKARYTGTYDWARAPFFDYAEKLGNTIKNSNAKNVTAQANMSTLYNKIPYFKKVNQKKPTQSRPAPKPPVKKPAAQDTLKKKKKEPEPPAVFEHLARLIMSVKSVSGSYTWNEGTILPGVDFKNNILGFNSGFSAPTPGFVFGFQDDSIARDAARGGRTENWLVEEPALNMPHVRTDSRNYNVRASVEPFKDIRVELTGNKNMGFSHSEFFRWNDSLQDFDNEHPLQTGNFSISYNTFKTAFVPSGDDSTEQSDVFRNFLENRQVISNRLSDKAGRGVNPNGFAEGYGETSMDVLIPAFLAAYSGQDAGKIDLNDRPRVPKPNWRVTYDGLSKLAFFKKYFRSFTLGHAYRSSYNIASYTTNLLFEDHDENPGLTTNRDLNNNYISQLQIAQISISEQFSPLIGVDMTWNNSLSTKVELKKDRNLAFNFADNRLQETLGKDVVVSLGYRFKQVKLPFKIGPTQATVRSDVNVRADVSVRDNVVIMRGLDGLTQITSGNNVVSIKTTADYVINQRVNLQLFFEKTLNRPKISNSFLNSNTNAGVRVRFTLS